MINTQANKQIHKSWAAVASLLLTFLLSGCGGGGGGSDKTSPVIVAAPQQTATCGGKSIDSDSQCITLNGRDSIFYQPTDQQNDGIAIFLHGSPGNAKKVMRIFDAKALASTYNLIALGPEGNTPVWGWDSINSTTETSNSDIDYLNELLVKIRGDYNITSDKLYIFGYSAGGFMTYKLACQIPEKITAIISLAGQYRGDSDACATSTSVNLHHFHSPTDNEVPFSGRAEGKIVSVDKTIALWQEKNGCDAETDTIQHSGVNSTSTGTSTEMYKNCVKSVALSKMENVPHESDYQADRLLEIYGYLLTEE